MTSRHYVIGVIALAVSLILGFLVVRSFGSTTSPASVRVVSDVAEDGTAYAVQHTFLCELNGNGAVARDWHFTDRWLKNQLTVEGYGVLGYPVTVLRHVTKDRSLPSGHVRFVRERESVAGPNLEGHRYLDVEINGERANMVFNRLVVEHNVQFEPQARPLPACGTPRS